MLTNRFYELRFQTKQSIEKLVVVSKNPELTYHTNNDISKCLKIVATSFLVNFLELEEPFIYGYVPRYISELVAKQGSLCENITIAFTQHLHACAVIDKEKKRNPFNLWKCNELTLPHTAIDTLQYSSMKTFKRE